MGKYRPKVQKQVSFAGRGSKKQLIWIFQSFGNSWIFQETHQPNGLCSVLGSSVRLQPRITQWADQQLNITTEAIVTGVDFRENGYLYLIFGI